MVKNSNTKSHYETASAVVVRLVSVLLIIALSLTPVVAHYNDRLNFGTGLLLGLVILGLAIVDVIGMVWHIVNVVRKRARLDSIALLLVGIAVSLYIAMVVIVNVS